MHRYSAALATAILVLTAYWLLVALLLPPTNYDGQTYNLTRLLLTQKYGFWSTFPWNTDRQVDFPWTFDAIHYPFCRLGWGFALPSFLCFLGILIAAYHYLKTTRGITAGLIACLLLLSMPTFVYQATTSKNDLGMTFGLAMMGYAAWRYAYSKDQKLLVLAAVAFGFSAGSKTTGIILGVPVFCAVLWLVRNNRRALVTYLGSVAVASVLLGNPEIYLRNYAFYKQFSGAPNRVRMLSNQDGAKGALANFVRYQFGFVSVGLDGGAFHTGLPWIAGASADRALRFLSIHDAGYGLGLGRKKANVEIRKNGHDDSSDFGLSGGMLVVLGYASLFWLLLRRNGFCAYHGWYAAALALLVYLSATIAWMPWNNRFLMPVFFCFAVGAGLQCSSKPPLWTFVLAGVALLSAVLAIGTSAIRRPADLYRSVFDRDHLTYGILPGLIPAFDFVKQFSEGHPGTSLILCGGNDAWAFSFLSLPNLNWQVAPNEAALAKVLERSRPGTLVLAIGNPAPQRAALLNEIYHQPAAQIFELRSNSEVESKSGKTR